MNGTATAGTTAEGEASAASDDGYARLIRDYRPLDGISDELLDSFGNVRAVWEPFLRDFARMSPEELARSLARGKQYLRDAGVFFRHYGPDSGEREWPLSHLPLVLDEIEWQQIAAGLCERADLLEKIMADIYGPARLVSDGILPPALLADNPEWLRPMVGVTPRSGHFLHFIAFDIGRGPDGKWWVLGDRTQAPSGAGFALETRLATARSFPGLMARTNVKRLAGFFRVFRDALLDLRHDDHSRVAILTPGPLNDTYFEHAYIARYLGFLLVQGEDLVVHDGQLMVHTVGGLRPLSVLWRRLDSLWTDPLELEESSQLGSPGLLGALRAGTLTTINSVGSGALEIRALMAFMPSIANYFNGTSLTLPNIATWWCGDESARAYVQDNAGRMTIDDALSTRPSFDHGQRAIIGGRTADGSPFNPAWIEAQAGTLAAQEIVSLSTAPALVDGQLTPRPMSLRVFLARTKDGWTVMPGGLARIGNATGTADISMQAGGAVSDVWIVSQNPAGDETLLNATAEGAQQRQHGALPSRSADNLFWLGRYIERAEQKVRLLRAYHLRLAESGSPDLPLSKWLEDYLESLDVSVAEPMPAGLIADCASAVNSAGNIRDRFSTDGWNALGDLIRTANNMATRLQPGDDAARAMSVLLRKISGFTGLVHENMYRFLGWRFLSIGRSVERAWSTTGFLSAFTAADAPEGTLDLAIEAGDSIMTHRRRYAVAISRETVLDLLLLDELNPRSVLHQMQIIGDHLRHFPVREGSSDMTPMRRAVMRLETDLAVSTAAEIDEDRLAGILEVTASLSGLLTATYLR